jgi:hypothetical protein
MTPLLEAVLSKVSQADPETAPSPPPDHVAGALASGVTPAASTNRQG